jgi:hypothetical protein
MAKWVCMSTLPMCQSLEDQSISYALCTMWPPDIYNIWNTVSKDKEAVAHLVSCHVVDDVSEDRRKCKES